MTGDADGLIASLASSYDKGVQPNPGLAGHFRLGAVTVSRIGSGAMQLSGDGVYGPLGIETKPSPCCVRPPNTALTTSTPPSTTDPVWLTN